MLQTAIKAMFSSATDMWETPQVFFDRLDAEFGFETDVCAVPQNTKCARYFTPAMDGLTQQWSGVCWMNPPYGRQIGAWVKKAYEASLHGATVVCLLPARTDTAWWHEYCMRGEIRFVRGRLRFGTAQASAPFPSAVVIFGPQRFRRLRAMANTAASVAASAARTHQQMKGGK
ncbi:MAG: DNA N-6-adenine-methyltransferase [Terracidiphilus sp.]